MARRRKIKTKADLLEEILALLEAHCEPGADELRILSSVTSYVLCNHIGNETLAFTAFGAFNNVINYTMHKAQEEGHTMWWGGTPH